MDIKIIASGSSGNCYLIADKDNNKLLIECGIPFKKLQNALQFDFKSIHGCLVSHEHKDHCKAIEDCLKYGINCYCSAGTANALELKHHNLRIIKAKQQFTLDNWVILPFEAQHDAQEPLCFLIQNQDNKLLFATDTYYIKYKFTGITHVMIECNYDLDKLTDSVNAGTINKARANRTLESHMNLGTCKEFFKANDWSKLQSITLIHISSDNGIADKFKLEIEAITGIPVVVG